MKKFYWLLAATALLLCFCKGNKNPVSFGYGQSDFAIYFLADEKLKMKDVYDKDLSELELALRPWLDANDIRFYDWSSHCIYLKKDKTHFIPGWIKGKYNNTFPEEWADKPFVVVAKGQKCYLGFFYRAVVSTAPWFAPRICDVPYNSSFPSDVIYVEWEWLYRDTPQDNPIVKDALLDAGLYHGGISIVFDNNDANTLRVIENADTSTVSYKFTLINKDVDDLYVLDPDKMGVYLFHEFTNGLLLYNLATRRDHYPNWRKRVVLPSPGYWSPDWYTKIKSGQSVQRTMVVKGYPYFTTDEYLFQFNFLGSWRNMEKEVREVANGRYWIGKTRSNVLTLVYYAAANTRTRQQLNAISNLRLNEY